MVINCGGMNMKKNTKRKTFFKKIYPIISLLLTVVFVLQGCDFSGKTGTSSTLSDSDVTSLVNGKPVNMLINNTSSSVNVLRPGDVIKGTKTITITKSIPKADIFFVFDLTGSMKDELTQVQQNAVAVMNDLDTLISDARYGVISFQDYNKVYSSCDYSATYGQSTDYPYSLDQNLTDDKTSIQTAIDGLTIGSGYDGPESYARALYETTSDPLINYRSDSKKIIIVFGDNIPHDCNIFEGITDVTDVRSTGKDPGRDGIMNTEDDIDFHDVLGELKKKQITMLCLYSGGPSYLKLWQHWTSLTGGTTYDLSTATEIPSAIKNIIEKEVLQIDELILKVTTPGYENWLTKVNPLSYSNINIDGTMDFTFDYEITVPLDVCTGVDGSVTHEIVLSVIGDGATYGKEDLSINVQCDDPMEDFNVKIFTASHKNLCKKTFDRISGLGTLKLADSGDLYNPESDDVVVTINGFEIKMPAGSFEKFHWFRRYSDNIFTFNGKVENVGHVIMVLNFKKGFWHVIVNGNDLPSIIADDTIELTLEIGSNVGSESFSWSKKWESKKFSFAKYIEKRQCKKRQKYN